MPEADTKTLEILAERLRVDAKRGAGISAAAAASIAEIIDAAIGAPVMWPIRDVGAIEADKRYPEDARLRLIFNEGVKWAVERYGPTVKISNRFD